MKGLQPLYKALGSSARWLARQQKDPYVKLRSSGQPGSQTSYRSRSSFKLVSLAEKHKALLRPGNVVVDLGAAPGGWSQVAIQALKGRGNVFAIDLLDVQPIDGVEILKGDFLSPAVRARLIESVMSLESKGSKTFKAGTGLADTVLSDMMASMSGIRDRDIQASLDLVHAATTFAKGVLKSEDQPKQADLRGEGSPASGGNLVMKFFQHPDLIDFRKEELDPFFRKVVTEKPKESRSESSEAYWVCLGYQGSNRVPDDSPAT